MHGWGLLASCTTHSGTIHWLLLHAILTWHPHHSWLRRAHHRWDLHLSLHLFAGQLLFTLELLLSVWRHGSLTTHHRLHTHTHHAGSHWSLSCAWEHHRLLLAHAHWLLLQAHQVSLTLSLTCLRVVRLSSLAWHLRLLLMRLLLVRLLPARLLRSRVRPMLPVRLPLRAFLRLLSKTKQGAFTGTFLSIFANAAATGTTWHHNADIDISALVVILSIKLELQVVIDVEQDIVGVVV